LNRGLGRTSGGRIHQNKRDKHWSLGGIERGEWVKGGSMGRKTAL